MWPVKCLQAFSRKSHYDIVILNFNLLTPKSIGFLSLDNKVTCEVSKQMSKYVACRVSII